MAINSAGMQTGHDKACGLWSALDKRSNKCLPDERCASLSYLSIFLFPSLSGMSDGKVKKDATNKEIINMSDAAGYLDRFVGDVSKKSATKQILIGAGSGW